MEIWLITVGEPLPTDGPSERLLRVGILADLLASKNHRVVWWTSTFDHVGKRHRFEKSTTVNISDNYQIRLLHSIPYSSNVSLSRIINHYLLARKFEEQARSERRPDVILGSFPPIELCVSATRYGVNNNVPVVLDIRDLWPDIFLDLFPAKLRGIAGITLSPYNVLANRACSNATAIVGLTEQFVEWGVTRAKRNRSELDKVFPMGYSERVPPPAEIEAAEKFWREFGLSKGDNYFSVCFFGTIGRQFDLKTIIEVAKILQSQSTPIRFVLCGTGDNYEYYKKMAEGCSNVILPGWVNASQIWTLMRIVQVGIAPYVDSPNFALNIPNKPIEYMSAGLPVVSSLRGVLDKLLIAHSCGASYENRNPHSLIQVLTELHDSQEKLQIMSNNALNLYKQSFIAERVYGEMIDYLETIAEKAVSAWGI